MTLHSDRSGTEISQIVDRGVVDVRSDVLFVAASTRVALHSCTLTVWRLAVEALGAVHRFEHGAHTPALVSCRRVVECRDADDHGVLRPTMVRLDCDYTMTHSQIALACWGERF